MLTLARWCTTHRRHVLVGWLALLVAVGALAEGLGASYSNNFSLPGSGAQRASDLLQRSFPAQAGDRDQIVLHATSGSLLAGPMRAHVDAMLARVRRLPQVSEVVSPYSTRAAGRAVSADGRTALATVVFDRPSSVLSGRAVRRVVAVAEGARSRGLQVALDGKAVEEVESSGFGLVTGIGLMAAVVVLLFTFGSLIAMGLPIVTALFGLGAGVGLIVLLTHVIEMPDFSSELAAMIGLGVGVDYALFIVTRFREAYATPGPTCGEVRESVVEAMNTAGRAVLFAGTTVVIAVLGMLLLGVGLLNGAAIASAIGVALVMLGSLTLLPALMTTAGHRLAQPHLLSRRLFWGPTRRAAAGGAPGAGGSQTGGAWVRWSAFVARRPWTIATVTTVAILLISSPVVALRLGTSDAANNPPGSTTERAYELLARGFGKGYSGPLLVVAQASGAHRRFGLAPLAGLASAVAGAPDVASVGPPRVNAGGSVATLSVYPRSAPQDYATTLLVERLRTHVIPPIARRYAIGVYVGGPTAGAIDFATTLGHKLPLFIGVVVLVSALLLLVVFRSLVIPLQGAIMNLLSIGASLGVVVAIFQWGWLDGLAGIARGPVESFIPVMLFAIVFGLSMDYEVFLVSRIHEQWRRTGSSSRAVGEGLSLTGRVITAAAAIMVAVFLSFFLGEERVIEEFGMSLATAVFVDALLVRCLLLPAVLHLLGERTWSLPAWLDRVLPRLNVEGMRDGAAGAERGWGGVSGPSNPLPGLGAARLAGAAGLAAAAALHAARSTAHATAQPLADGAAE